MVPPRTCAILSLLVALFTISCSEEEPEDTITGPLLAGDAPGLPIPVLRQNPDFASRSTAARYARGFVVGQLNRVRPIAQEAAAAMPILTQTGFASVSDECRSRQIGGPPPENCMFTISVCAVDGGLQWSETVSGPCGLSSQGPSSYGSWVRLVGASNRDGTAGEFNLYRSASSEVSQSWSWRTDSARNLTEWTFYRGLPSPASRLATLILDQSDPSRWRGEYAWSPSEKWTADFASDGTSGRLTVLTYHRERREWIPYQEVDWVPAHGTWVVFDAAGAPIETREW